MSRGPVSTKALETALSFATLRGAVYFFQPGREAPAHFAIVNKEGVTLISVKMARCLHSPGADIEWTYRDAVFRLRTVPIAPNVFRELWLLSRYGRWRFFGVRDRDLIELAIPPEGGVP
jgi:hypothetical protein